MYPISQTIFCIALVAIAILQPAAAFALSFEPTATAVEGLAADVALRAPSVTSPNGDFWMAFYEGTYDGHQDIYLAGIFPGNGSQLVGPINTTAATDSADVLDRNPRGLVQGSTVIVVWTRVDGDEDVYFTRFPGSLPFNAAQPLNPDAGTDVESDRDVDIASDGAGNWIAVWHSGGYLGGPRGADGDIVFARSTDDGASWSAPAAIDSAATSDTASDIEPRILYAAGTWTVVWSNDSDGNYDVVLSRSTDSGTSWSAPATLDTNADSDSADDVSASLTSDHAGNWIAAWNTDGAANRVYAAASADDGQTWAEAKLLSTGTENSRPSISTDRNGEWAVVWQSAASGDILLSFSTNLGTSWSVAGEINSTSASGTMEDRNPVLLSVNGKWLALWDALGTPNAETPEMARIDYAASVSPLCPLPPMRSCLGAGKSSLLIRASADGAKNQIKWKFGKGDEYPATVLGSDIPRLTLCIYDQVLGVDELRDVIVVSPSDNWTSKGPKGLFFDDSEGIQDGITKVALKPGAQGRSGVSLTAKGTRVPMAEPRSESSYFSLDSKVTVQFIASIPEEVCWQSEFTVARTNDGTGFKAIGQ